MLPLFQSIRDWLEPTPQAKQQQSLIISSPFPARQQILQRVMRLAMDSKSDSAGVGAADDT